MPELKCENGTVIRYRLPNVIELFDLQDKSGWGDKTKRGWYRLARILENTEPFIESISGKKNWDACINDRGMADDLSDLALSLMQDELDDEEKKS
jgi:hypothetical protein